MCVTARGKSSTLSIELTIPLIISAPLVLLAPFFGTFQKQVTIVMSTQTSDSLTHMKVASIEMMETNRF